MKIPAFRPDRFFFVLGEGWYYLIRGDAKQGPFINRVDANIDLHELIANSTDKRREIWQHCATLPITEL